MFEFLTSNRVSFIKGEEEGVGKFVIDLGK